MTAAFPYPNSPLHLGHGRTYTIADVYARFKRMQGYNVLFPMGFHYTGTPIITMADAIASGDPDLIDLMLNVYDVPKEDLEKLKTALGMARYFHEDMKQGMKELGMSIDWRREFTSIDPEFSKLVEWQFIKLREKGLVVKGTHPVGWCPVHNMPVSMHDTKNDVEPEIGEFTLILFRLAYSDTYLPAATLRAETVFGVTNLWLNPKAKYVLAEVDGRKYILSERAAFKLRFQKDEVKVIEEVDPRTLLGKYAVNPATGERVPILPADFVDPDTATGVVMSVPAHAPYDYVALKDIVEGRKYPEFKDIASKLKPIPLIRVKGYSELPAKDVVEKLRVSSQDEKEKLEEATKKVYSDEYKYGVVREDITERVYRGMGEVEVFAKAAVKAWIAGRSVSEAREATEKWLKALGFADTMYEIMNRPVYCRCGNEIVVKVLKDQWFINYGDSEWKRKVMEALNEIRIIPETMREEFVNTVEWLGMRAAARTRGLGTPLPWEKGWIIESLSDSTIYMAFYTVSHLIKRYGIQPEKLTYEFWDYVLLGKGDPKTLSSKIGIPEDLLRELHREFDYWYPVDSRHSGRDLVQNHLTFYIFNHVAIFPRDKWPKQIVVNGFVKLEGKKMSKSLRNVIPLRRTLRIYGPDTVRASLIIAAEILQDADFTDSLARSVLAKLEEIYKLVKRVAEAEKERESEIARRWLLSRLQERIETVTKHMEELRLRHALVALMYEMPRDFEKYLDLGGSYGGEAARKFVDSWVRMLAPFIPHLAEEMWQIMGGKGFVSTAKWPTPEKEYIDLEAELIVAYVDAVISDVKKVLEVYKAGKPSTLVIAVEQPSSWNIVNMVAQKLLEGLSIREVVREVLAGMDEAMRRRYGRQLHRIAERLVDMGEDVIRAAAAVTEFDEARAIEILKSYVSSKLGIEDVKVVYSESKEAESLMPKQKLSTVIPLRPAIYVK